MSEELQRLAATSLAELHGISTRAGAPAVASELLRLNTAVRDLARPMLRFTDQQADFPATLLRLADPGNG